MMPLPAKLYFIWLPLVLCGISLLGLAWAALPYVLAWVILFYGWVFR